MTLLLRTGQPKTKIVRAQALPDLQAKRAAASSDTGQGERATARRRVESGAGEGRFHASVSAMWKLRGESGQTPGALPK